MLDRLGKITLLAALYFLAGKLGLTLAVPPGYATVIWPPSGLALGALILYGRGIAPGVFLGSFLLNALVGHGAQDLPTARAWLLSLCIASGSTVRSSRFRRLMVQLVSNWHDGPASSSMPRQNSKTVHASPRLQISPSRTLKQS